MIQIYCEQQLYIIFMTRKRIFYFGTKWGRRFYPRFLPTPNCPKPPYNFFIEWILILS